MEYIGKDIYGHKVKDLTLYAFGGLMGCYVVKRLWWRYQNGKTQAKGRRAL